MRYVMLSVSSLDLRKNDDVFLEYKGKIQRARVLEINVNKEDIPYVDYVFKLSDGSEIEVNEDSEIIRGVINQNFADTHPNIFMKEDDMSIEEFEEKLNNNKFIIKPKVIDSNDIIFPIEKAMEGLKSRHDFDSDDNFVNYLYNEYNLRFFDNKLPNPSIISTNPQFGFDLGYKGFWLNDNNNEFIDETKSFKNPTLLYINPECLNDKKSTLSMILLHEMCHVYVSAFCHNSDKNHVHGHEWRSIMMKIGMNPNLDRHKLMESTWDSLEEAEKYGTNINNTFVRSIDKPKRNQCIEFYDNGRIKLGRIVSKNKNDIDSYLVLDIDGRLYPNVSSNDMDFPRDDEKIKSLIPDKNLKRISISNRNSKYQDMKEVLSATIGSPYYIHNLALADECIKRSIDVSNTWLDDVIKHIKIFEKPGKYLSDVVKKFRNERDKNKK